MEKTPYIKEQHVSDKYANEMIEIALKIRELFPCQEEKDYALQLLKIIGEMKTQSHKTNETIEIRVHETEEYLQEKIKQNVLKALRSANFLVEFT